MKERHAQCSCGSVQITARGEPGAVVVCHCLECQRRTGSVLGIGAYYSPEQVTIQGSTQKFSRPCDSGETLTSNFCPKCGTSIFWKVEEEQDARIGIAVGAFADPSYPSPNRSVWEQSKHSWIGLNSIEVHFPKGRA